MAAAYRKAIVAAIGVVFIVAAQFLSTFAGLQDQLVLVVDGVIGVLTAYGVFRAPNDAPAPPTGTAPLGASDGTIHVVPQSKRDWD